MSSLVVDAKKTKKRSAELQSAKHKMGTKQKQEQNVKSKARG